MKRKNQNTNGYQRALPYGFLLRNRTGGSAIRRGISLLEVTASTATVAVLLVLLASSFGSLRREGKEIRCLANMGRIAAAAAVYTSGDPNDQSIPVHPQFSFGPGTLGEFEWGGKSGIGDPSNSFDPMSSKWGTQQGRGPSSRPMNAILVKDRIYDFTNEPGANEANWLADTNVEIDVLRCPGDYGYAGHHLSSWQNSGLTSYDHFGNSYAANSLWVGRPGGNCTVLSNSPLLRPITQLTSPARTILFEENPAHYAWRRNYGKNGCQLLNGGPLSYDIESSIRGWHGTPFSFNLSFADAHAAKTHVNGHLHDQPDIGRWPEFDGAAGSWQRFHCSIIRGANWQRDTLPAPPIPTNQSCSSAGAHVIPIN